MRYRARSGRQGGGLPHDLLLKGPVSDEYQLQPTLSYSGMLRPLSCKRRVYSRCNASQMSSGR